MGRDATTFCYHLHQENNWTHSATARREISDCGNRLAAREWKEKERETKDLSEMSVSWHGARRDGPQRLVAQCSNRNGWN